MQALTQSNDTGGYDADDPKSPAWSDVQYGARLQRIHEDITDPTRGTR